MIWVANMHWKRKISLMIMFGGGFLELVFGILRCVSVLTVSGLSMNGTVVKDKKNLQS